MTTKTPALENCNVLRSVFSYVDNPADRKSISEVCSIWKKADSETRKEIFVENCYSVHPQTLARRFPNLESLRVQEKFPGIKRNFKTWGGHAKPWVQEVATSYKQKMKQVSLESMFVTDEDLALLSRSCSQSLSHLLLHKCFGFSIDGLAKIALCCRSLKVLSLEGSDVSAASSSRENRWVYLLAHPDSQLEYFNFQCAFGWDSEPPQDHLELLAQNCKSLRLLKAHDIMLHRDVVTMLGKLQTTSTLSELGTGSCIHVGDSETLEFPDSVTGLYGLCSLPDDHIPKKLSLLHNLKTLNLQNSSLSRRGHATILSYCVNLEILCVGIELGSIALLTLAGTCTKLRKFTMTNEPHPYHVRAREDEDPTEYMVKFLQGCGKNLESLDICVTHLNHTILKAVGDHCPALQECSFDLLENSAAPPAEALNEGVMLLLKGCQNLTSFGFLVQPGALTDVGLMFIGAHGKKLKRIILRCAGNTCAGILGLGLRRNTLEELQIRECMTTERDVADVVGLCTKLKYILVEGVLSCERGQLFAGRHPTWIMQYYDRVAGTAGQISGQFPILLGYRSLAGRRPDYLPERDIIDRDSHYEPYLTTLNAGPWKMCRLF